MLKDNQLNEVVNILKLLADPTRLKIVLSLMEGEKCVGDIVNIVGGTQSAISHQLNTMRASNLIKYNKVGNKVVYRVADNHVNQVVELCIEHAKEAK